MTFLPDPSQHPIVLTVTQHANTIISYVERYGWHALLLTLLTYFAYRYIVHQHHHIQVYAPARVESLTEKMRLQRLKQQAAWNENAKVVVEQTKIQSQIEAENRKTKKKTANPYEHRLGHKDDDDDSDDDNSELGQIFRDAIAAKGGKINGKQSSAARASGLSAAAFGRASGPNAGGPPARNRWSSSRQNDAPRRS